MQTLILTGATGNLGASVTEFFLNKGWHVHASCVSEAQAELLPNHEYCSYTIGNLAIESAVEDLFAEAKSISAVVHLVGGIEAGISFSETPIEVFESMILLNTRTTFLVIRQALRSLQSGGSIVTIGAKAALHPVENKSCYAAAKAASISLTMTAAEEGKAKNIRANVIIPGVIRTPANLEWASNGEENSWTLPEEIASAIYLLCSDNGKGISGAVIPMYGKLPT